MCTEDGDVIFLILQHGSVTATRDVAHEMRTKAACRSAREETPLTRPDPPTFLPVHLLVTVRISVLTDSEIKVVSLPSVHDIPVITSRKSGWGLAPSGTVASSLMLSSCYVPQDDIPEEGLKVSQAMPHFQVQLLVLQIQSGGLDSSGSQGLL